jgi:hypothetical protein
MISIWRSRQQAAPTLWSDVWQGAVAQGFWPRTTSFRGETGGLEMLAGDPKGRATEEVAVVLPEGPESDPLGVAQEPGRLVVAAGRLPEAGADAQGDPEREALGAEASAGRRRWGRGHSEI